MCRVTEAILANMRAQVSSMPQDQFNALLLNAILIEQREGMQGTCRQRRRVSFQGSQVVSEVTPCTSMTPEERANIWYTQDDLIAFKNEARYISRKIRFSPEEVEESRGLEHRISSERQQRKCLAIRAIIKAQSSHPEQLPMIASRSSAWAKEMALRVGHRDFYQAYQPELAHLVPMTLPTTHPEFPSTRKREIIVTVDDNSEEQVRRTRPRVMDVFEQ
jgi:hypothetical protein